MRVYAVTPVHVCAEELARRQQRYDRISPAGVTVELHDVGSAAPRTLETCADVRNSARLVSAALRTADDAGYDVLLPDCVLDPGVDGLAGELTTPVHGQFRLTLDHIPAARKLAGAVTKSRAVAEELAARAAAYGAQLIATAILDLDGTAVGAHMRWLAALGTAVNELADAGAEMVINGCSAGELDNVRSGRIPLVDPAVAALQRLSLEGATRESL